MKCRCNYLRSPVLKVPISVTQACGCRIVDVGQIQISIQLYLLKMYKILFEKSYFLGPADNNQLLFKVPCKLLIKINTIQSMIYLCNNQEKSISRVKKIVSMFSFLVSSLVQSFFNAKEYISVFHGICRIFTCDVKNL